MLVCASYALIPFDLSRRFFMASMLACLLYFGARLAVLLCVAGEMSSPSNLIRLNRLFLRPLDLFMGALLLSKFTITDASTMSLAENE